MDYCYPLKVRGLGFKAQMQELAVLAGLTSPRQARRFELLFLGSQSNVWFKLCLHKGAPEISSGLRIKRNMGMMWSVMSRCSRVVEFWMDVMWEGIEPRWVTSSINRVYDAVSRVAIPVRMIVRADQLNRVTMMVSSAMRFVVGGRAMFVKLANSHQVAMRGSRGWRPRVSSRIRLCVRS